MLNAVGLVWSGVVSPLRSWSQWRPVWSSGAVDRSGPAAAQRASSAPVVLNRPAAPAWLPDGAVSPAAPGVGCPPVPGAPPGEPSVLAALLSAGALAVRPRTTEPADPSAAAAEATLE